MSREVNDSALAEQSKEHLVTHTRVEHLTWLRNKKGAENRPFALSDSDEENDDWTGDGNTDQGPLSGETQIEDLNARIADSWQQGDDAEAMELDNGAPTQRTRSSIKARASVSVEAGAQNQPQAIVTTSAPARNLSSFRSRSRSASSRRRFASPEETPAERHANFQTFKKKS